MSDQADALNKVAREAAGSAVDPSPPSSESAEKTAPALPYIEILREDRDILDFAREAGQVCSCNGVFKMGGMPVTLDQETGAVVPMTPNRFRSYLADHAVIFKWKAGEKREDGTRGEPSRVKVTMTKDVAAAVLEADGFLNIQRDVRRVNLVRAPVMRRDGKIELLHEGFDRDSKILTMPSPVVIREDMEVEEARHIIHDLHHEFDFADWDAERKTGRSLGVQVTALESLWASALISPTANRMNFLYNANSHRSGKTLLAKIPIITVLGRCKVRSLPDSKDEFRKVLDTTALSAAPYLLLDDLDGSLKNQDLNAFMTASYWSGRMMNTQREFEVPKLTTVFLTGHNLTMTSDLAGRVLQCKLHIEEADVQDRRVQRIIDDDYLADDKVRSDVLSALWALVRGWDRAGRPKASRRFAGFETWCDIYGGIATFSGLGDPMQKLGEDESADSEADDMTALVRALADGVDRHAEYTFDQVIEQAVELNCFSWIIDGKWKSDGDSGERWYEMTKKADAIMGRLFSSKYGGRIFTLADGRRVRFGMRGRNRHRRYLVSFE